MYSLSGILFNHESSLRGIEFVTRRITNGLARITPGLARELALGDLDAKQDRGHSRDYVRAMWIMSQQDAPDNDMVVTTHTVVTCYDLCALQTCVFCMTMLAKLCKSKMATERHAGEHGRGDG